MAMGGGGSSKGVKSEINVTPLVDVCLVLLIIFMVVTPMLQRGKDVKLPQAHKIDEQNKEGDPIILSVTKDKRVFVESDQYDDDGLSSRIANELRAAPGRKLLLKGDQSLTYGDVRRVLELTRKAGARSISLGVEELKKK
jgi:biopolymer transport protein TolR